MNTRKPAEVFPPGDFIREELEARRWTQEDLARIMGRPLTTINLLINGRRGITPETAAELGAAFGTSAQVWLNLEAAYKLWRVSRAEELDQIRERAELLEASRKH